MNTAKIPDDGAASPLAPAARTEWDPVCVQFVEVIIEFRHRRGLSQAGVAAAAGVSEEMVRKMELKLTMPSLEHGLWVCRACEVSFGFVAAKAERLGGNPRAAGGQL